MIIKQMLTACYSCDYDYSVEGDDHEMNFNALIFAAADKYMIPFLKNLAKSKLQQQLVQLNTEDIPKMVEIIPTIYTTSLDRTLRTVLFPVIRRLRHSLQMNAEFIALVKSGLADGDFAADVFEALVGLSFPKTYYCSHCQPDRKYAKNCQTCWGELDSYELEDHLEDESSAI